MAQPPATKRQRLTRLGRKYGNPTGPQHHILREFEELKSGLTPIDMRQWGTTDEIVRGRLLERYQQWRFGGFSAAALSAIECFAPTYEGRGISIGDDFAAIHPIFSPSNWGRDLPKHLATFPLGNGRRGNWEASNPIVWRAIKPALQLATLLIEDEHFLSWWDALAYGDYEQISPSELPEEFQGTNKSYLRFRAREAAVIQSPRERDRVKTRLRKVAEEIDIHIVSGYVAVDSGLLPDQHRDACTFGTTRSRSQKAFREKVVLLLAFEMMEPLLNTHLNDAERAIQTFILAAVIVHETAHIFWLTHCRDMHKKYELGGEPFFEDEVTSELGYSLENYIFGGVLQPINHAGRGLLEGKPLAAGLFCHKWDNVYWAIYSKRIPVLTTVPAGYMVTERAPVPMFYFLSLISPEFWTSYIKRFGARACKAGPLVACMRHTYKNIMDNGQKNDSSRSAVILDPEADLSNIRITNIMSQEEVDAINMENARRQGAIRIAAAVKQYIKDRKKAQTAADRILERDPLFEGYPQLFNELGTTSQELERIIVEGEDEAQSRQASKASQRLYDSIEQYLFDNRYELALDSMETPMPEHTLFNYIQRNGGLNIDADDWSNFLLVTHQRKRLFSYKKHLPTWGIIRRIPEGWPRTPLKPHPKPFFRPSNAVFRSFRMCVVEVLKSHGVFEDGFMDHDIEDFRKRINYYYKRDAHRRVKTILGFPIKEFDRRVMDSLIWYYDSMDLGLTFGPEGVLRWVPSRQAARMVSPRSPTPPPNDPQAPERSPASSQRSHAPSNSTQDIRPRPKKRAATDIVEPPTSKAPRIPGNTSTRGAAQTIETSKTAIYRAKEARGGTGRYSRANSDAIFDSSDLPFRAPRSQITSAPRARSRENTTNRGGTRNCHGGLPPSNTFQPASAYSRNTEGVTNPRDEDSGVDYADWTSAVGTEDIDPRDRYDPLNEVLFGSEVTGSRDLPANYTPSPIPFSSSSSSMPQITLPNRLQALNILEDAEIARGGPAVPVRPPTPRFTTKPPPGSPGSGDPKNIFANRNPNTINPFTGRRVGASRKSGIPRSQTAQNLAQFDYQDTGAGQGPALPSSRLESQFSTEPFPTFDNDYIEPLPLAPWPRTPSPPPPSIRSEDGASTYAGTTWDGVMESGQDAEAAANERPPRSGAQLNAATDELSRSGTGESRRRDRRREREQTVREPREDEGLSNKCKQQ